MRGGAKIKKVFERNARAMSLRPSIAQGTATTRVEILEGVTCIVEDGPWRLTVDLGERSRAATIVGPEGEVVATDISQKMIDQARDRAAERRLSNITFERLGAEEPGMDEGGFDAALCAGGPVALAYSRFDEKTRAEAHAEYLASIEPYRSGDGYQIPGEFVVARAEKG